MKPLTLAGIVLIIIGALGLAYGSFSYTKDTHEARLGSIELSVTEKETVNIPVWLGAGSLVLGAVLLMLRTRN